MPSASSPASTSYPADLTSTAVGTNSQNPVNNLVNGKRTGRPYDLDQCADTFFGGNNDAPAKTYWFRLDGDSRGKTVELMACGFDTDMVLYRGPDCSQLEQVACDGDSAIAESCDDVSFGSMITYTLPEKGEGAYYVAVSGYQGGTGVANVAAAITITPTPTPMPLNFVPPAIAGFYDVACADSVESTDGSACRMYCEPSGGGGGGSDGPETDYNAAASALTAQESADGNEKKIDRNFALLIVMFVMLFLMFAGLAYGGFVLHKMLNNMTLGAAALSSTKGSSVELRSNSNMKYEEQV